MSPRKPDWCSLILVVAGLASGCAKSRENSVCIEAATRAREAALQGELGFISSVAEFTPKTVQTEELRTSLVYEVRVFVEDPDDRLRLGMPATVRFDLESDSAATEPQG